MIESRSRSSPQSSPTRSPADSCTEHSQGPTMTTLIWLRDDLRLADHPALTAACSAAHRPVVALWIHETRRTDDDNFRHGPRPLGAATRWWYHRSLRQLATRLANLGIPLVFARGDAATIMRRTVRPQPSPRCGRTVSCRTWRTLGCWTTAPPGGKTPSHSTGSPVNWRPGSNWTPSTAGCPAMPHAVTCPGRKHPPVESRRGCGAGNYRRAKP